MNINIFNHKRLILADKLIRFSLDKKINNVYLIKTIFYIYESLVKGVYVSGHTSANNHYIPQFLLKKFRIPNTGLIYEYTYIKEPDSVSIEKKAAQSLELYTSTDKDTKNKSEFIEKQLFAFTLEKYASRIINEVLEKDEVNLTSLEQSILTTFMAFQYVRTPKFFYYIRITLEYLNLNKGIPVEDMTKKDFFKKAFFDNIYNIKPNELAEFSIKNDLVISNAKNLVLSISIQIGNYLSSVIFKNDLRMLEAKAPAYFYLSDNPANIFNIEKDRSVAIFLWEFGVNSLVYMPISPNRCLYYTYTQDNIPSFVIGSIIEVAIQDSIYEYAYSDRLTSQIQTKFENNETL